MTRTRKNCVKRFWGSSIFRHIPVIILALLFFVPHNAPASDESQESGQPVPRFVTLRSDNVNMRVGPGVRYNINWVYKHEGLPVEVIREFEQWREIRDSDGTVGWVHKQMLQGKRAVVIRKGIAVMRKSPDAHANPVIRVEPGVIGKLIGCDPEWCKVQIADHKGWFPKTAIWGAYKNEKF